MLSGWPHDGTAIGKSSRVFRVDFSRYFVTRPTTSLLVACNGRPGVLSLHFHPRGRSLYSCYARTNERNLQFSSRSTEMPLTSPSFSSILINFPDCNRSINRFISTFLSLDHVDYIFDFLIIDFRVLKVYRITRFLTEFEC